MKHRDAHDKINLGADSIRRSAAAESKKGDNLKEFIRQVPIGFLFCPHEMNEVMAPPLAKVSNLTELRLQQMSWEKSELQTIQCLA